MSNRRHPKSHKTPVKLASIQLELSADQWTVVPHRRADDLPTELKGDKLSFLNRRDEHGYYITVGTKNTAVEYINHKWYYLAYDQQTRTYLTKETLTLTEQELLNQRLACVAPPPPSNLLTAREPTLVVPKEDKPTPVVLKLIRTDSDDEDLYKLARGAPLMPRFEDLLSNPILPEEEAFLSAAVEHVATLEHADHPEEPITHQCPHLTTIKLAL